MKKSIAFLILLLLSTLPLRAQIGGGSTNISGGSLVIGFAGVPSGTCGALQLAVNTTNGNLYTCNAGTWTLSGGGGGSCAEGTCIINAPTADQTITGAHALILSDAGSNLITPVLGVLPSTLAMGDYWAAQTSLTSAVPGSGGAGVGFEVENSTVTDFYYGLAARADSATEADLYGFTIESRTKGANKHVANIFGVGSYFFLNATGTSLVDKALSFYAAAPSTSGGGVNNVTTSVAYWSDDLASGSAIATNPYYSWFDSQGVRRIKEDNTFDSVGQAIEALYNPQFTKYTPGAVNFERIILGQWSGNVAQIGTEAGGTGTLRKVKMIGAGFIAPDLEIPGSSSGTATIVAAAVAGTPTLTLPTTSGTLALQGTAVTGGTCTNQAVTAISVAGVPTCTTLTSAYVNSSIGLTGSPLSQFAATTSAQLAGIISDETGSGALVFAASPTITGTLTAAIINASGIATFSQNGAASASGFNYTGTAPTGTGTTAFPAFYLNAGTGPTTFSTNGTVFGINAASGFAGNVIDLHVNGGGSIFKVDSAGALTTLTTLNGSAVTVTGSVSAGAAGGLVLTGRSKLVSAADGRAQILANANGLLTRLSFGAETTSFPALCNSASVIKQCLGDGTDGGSFSANAYGTSTNCSNGASPAVCASAPSGAVAVPTGTNPTLTINTTAVTANSRIFLNVDESLTISATTCNTTLSTLVQPVVTARTAGTSFTIQIGAVITSNPACVSYFVVN